MATWNAGTSLPPHTQAPDTFPTQNNWLRASSVGGLWPVAERFGHVDPADILGAGEVGDGAGDAKHAMVAARGKPHRRRGIGEQFPAGIVRGRDRVEQI